MKKAFWWILGILLSPVLLFVVLTVLLYLPPVQNWLVDRVAAYASEQTGMEITVDRVNLSFPLDLGVNGVRVIHQPDTIADVERVVVDVQLLPLFKSKVVINQLELNNTRLNTNGFVDAARVKGYVGLLSVKSDGIDLKQETIALNGARLEDAQLDIAMNDSVPEDTTTSEARWKIYVDEAQVKRSDIAFHMPGDTMSVRAHFGTLAAREARIDLGAQTYTIASVDWDHGALLYDQNFQPRVEGLDYNHLDLTNINIGIDSIYYHAPTLRLQMRSVALREKNGLQVTDLTGPVVMENGSILLPKFHLKTPESDINVELAMPLNLTDSIDPGKLQLRLAAQVGRRDLLHFMGDMPQAFRDRWPDQLLTLKGALNGNLQHMELNDIDVALPTAFHVQATGFAANLDNPSRLRADVQFKAQTQRLDFVMALLPRDVQRNYRLPNGMSAAGRVKADGANYTTDMMVQEGKGR
ncbi:MAG: phage tail protein, partial [Prevotella sp.]|nr:phage tail protein [Prevotella sp.]